MRHWYLRLFGHAGGQLDGNHHLKQRPLPMSDLQRCSTHLFSHGGPAVQFDRIGNPNNGWRVKPKDAEPVKRAQDDPPLSAGVKLIKHLHVSVACSQAWPARLGTLT